MANIATGDFGIRGNINDIQSFLEDAKQFKHFSFNLNGLDEFDVSEETVDIDQYKRIKIYLPVDFRWEIDVSELEQLSKDYNLDFWSLVFDTGVALIHEVCIKNGKVVYDYQQNYVTWDGEF